MKRAVFASMLIVVLAVAAIAVVAQGRGMMGGRMGQGNQSMTCQQALGLTQAQAADIQRLRTAFMNDTAALRTEMQTKQQEMMGLWAVATPNLAQIKAKSGEMDQIRARIQDKAIDLHFTIVTTVLTPDQRAKCISLCQSGKCGMGGGMGMGACPMMGGGMGPGAGMGMGPGAGMGARGGCGMGAGPTGTGCPMTK